MKEALIDVPSPIQYENYIFDISFHPSRDVVGVGLVDGSVVIHEYSPQNGNRYLKTYNNHQKTCRALQLTETAFYSASRDKSILCCDLDSGNVIWKIDNAHGSAVNVMTLRDNLLISGDDDGEVKVWDIRENKEVLKFQENVDYISDMLLHENTLICTSGDGTIGVYNIAQGKVVQRSENLDDELLSISLLKNGSRVVCGSQGGILDIYTWGEWSDIGDRFPGHPESIECMCKIDEDIVCTGSSDGLIRIVNIQPNKLLGVLGEHEEYPVELLVPSCDNKYIASSSHEDILKFWNIDFFYNTTDENDDQDITEFVENKFSEHKENKSKSNQNNMKNFFSEL